MRTPADGVTGSDGTQVQGMETIECDYSRDQVMALKSSHSCCKKWLFGTFATSNFVLLTVAGMISSVYTLAFNCDPGVIGLILLVTAIFDVFKDPIVGHMQDRANIARCFDKHTWGSRAPWLVTHLPVISVVLFLVLVPPRSAENTPTMPTYIWLSICILALQWCHTVNNTACSSAIAEIYPLQKERSQLVGISTVYAWGGAFVGLLATTIIIGDAENSLDRCCAEEFKDNLPKGCTFKNHTSNSTLVFSLDVDSAATATGPTYRMALLVLLTSLVSCCAIWPMKDAKLLASKEVSQGSLWTHLKYFISLRSFSTLFVTKMADTLSESLFVLTSTFFLRFVVALDRDEIAKAGLAVALAGAFAQLIGMAFFTYLFGTTSSTNKVSVSVNPRLYAFSGRLINTILTPIFVELCDAGYDSDGIKAKGTYFGLPILFFLSRLCYSPLAFFYTNARSWVIDEDVQDMQNRKHSRRDALICSLISTATKISVILAAAFFATISVAGIDTTSTCWGEAQPKGAVGYVKATYQILIPLLNIVAAVCVYLFPIHGARLAQLENMQIIQRQQNATVSGNKVVPFVPQ